MPLWNQILEVFQRTGLTFIHKVLLDLYCVIQSHS